MDNRNEVKWLVEIFVQYQEMIDSRRKVGTERMWLKEALEIDKKKRDDSFDSAASLDAC